MAHHEQICGFTPYPESIHRLEGCTVFMANTDAGDRLIVIGESLGFVGKREHREDKECLVAPLSHENARRLRQVFPFTAPRPGLHGGCSVGVGDRLGVATAGHLRVFKKYPQVFPVLAQQSIRELNLTQRSYEDVLDCATFAVFTAGYKRGFGADGDHLKKPEEIEYALRCGYSMITLDCSEHIRGDAAHLSGEELAARYQPDPELEGLYLDQEIAITPGVTLSFDRENFMRTVLIYGEAIGFMRDIYARYVQGQPVDFEISIDGPYYYVTSIEQAKLRLLGKATENAFQRANLIADNSGGKTGKLVEASQGIFQITEPDSTEVSDYGMYSISTIEKDIKAVVTLKYRIED